MTTRGQRTRDYEQRITELTADLAFADSVIAALMRRPGAMFDADAAGRALDRWEAAHGLVNGRKPKGD
jgi:hypothetical protein